MKTYVQHIHMYRNVRSSITRNSQKLEQTQCTSADEWTHCHLLTWGLTDHVYLLQIEEGSKAAAVDKLLAGDEIVGINDVGLSGFRQEAICLVKGSHKTLKLVVKRRNEPSWRPHSWHATKFSDSHPETSTSQFTTGGTCPSWHARHHASSSQDLSSSWEQRSLWHTLDHAGSLGSVDSLDPRCPPCPLGRLLATRSNSSVDRLGGASQRDSAYSSFSTSSSTPDHTLPRADASCSDGTPQQACLWEATRPGSGEEGRATGDLEPHRSPGQEDNPEPRPPPPGRPSFGPVWYVPDKRKAPSSPPLPPPPLHSDSFGATRGHEKTQGPLFPEAAAAQHWTALAQAQAWGNWRAEPPDVQPRPTLSDERGPGSSSCSTDPRRHCAWLPSGEGVGGWLQALRSSSDVHLAPTCPRYLHPHQYSDEGPFLHDGLWLATSPWDQQELPANCLWDGSPTQARWLRADAQSGDTSGHSCYYCVTTKQPGLGGGLAADLSPGAQECLPTAPVGQKPRCGSLQPDETLDAERGRGCPPDRGGEGWPPAIGEPQRACHVGKAGQRTASGDFRWGDGASSKISAQKTPLLHCLTQEGESRPTPGQEGGAETPLPFDTQVGKPMRRSNQFATTLWNEIQLRHAKLQKSRSSASLAGAPEAKEEASSCRLEAGGAPGAPRGGSFTGTYKDHLKEAQARVLRATLFKRRDLEPSLADRYAGCPGQRPGGSSSPSSFTLDPAVAPQFWEAGPAKLPSSAGCVPHVPRVGGRRRFTVEQKLKSYSEPEKINEVGLSGGCGPHQHPETSEDTVGTFANRWKFFEETSKPTCQRPRQRQALCGLPKERPESARTARPGSEGTEPWYQKGARRTSSGEHLSSWGKAEKVGKCKPPQRLGTFAEYQASWQEQQKPVEARSSGRYHSADDILDVGLDPHEKPQYVHGRSRSSPSAEHYVQEAPIEPQRQAGQPGDHRREVSSTLRPQEGCAAPRQARAQRQEDSLGARQEPTGRNPRSQSEFCDPSHSGVSPELLQEGQGRGAPGPRQCRALEESTPADPLRPPGSGPPGHPSAQPPPGGTDAARLLSAARVARRPTPQWPPPPRREPRRCPGADSADSTAAAEGAAVGSQPPIPGRPCPPRSTASLDASLARLSLAQSPCALAERQGGAQPPGAPKAACGEHEGEPVDEQPPAHQRLQPAAMETSRSPSPQFAPQKLTDKPPLLIQDESSTRYCALAAGAPVLSALWASCRRKQPPHGRRFLAAPSWAVCKQCPAPPRGIWTPCRRGRGSKEQLKFSLTVGLPLPTRDEGDVK
ncbi:protein Shroom2-like [Choloepus didactylus]|uniref:protein Shroom2-like n=1 Tax=Choloepus didactylus TaxID=27675 RepID=UPI00189E1FB6|nr:protein Shroom2-like [Choloepus didactylus]